MTKPDVNGAPPKLPRRKRFRKPVRLILAGISILSVLGIIGVLGNLEWQLHVIERDIRAAGLPVDIQELNPYYAPIPDERNGALVFEKAFQALNEASDGLESPMAYLDRIEALEATAPLPDELAEDVASYLAVFEPAMKLARQAASYPEFRFPVDLSIGLGFDETLVHLGPHRYLYRLVLLQSELAAHRGNWDGVVAAYWLMDSLGRSLETEPLLLTQLVRAAFHQYTRDALERLLSRYTVPSETLRAIRDSYGTNDPRSMLYRSYAVERCTQVNDRLYAGGRFYGDHTTPLFREGRRIRQYVRNPKTAYGTRRVQLAIYGYYGALLRVVPQDWPHWISSAQDVDRSLDDAGKVSAAVSISTDIIPRTVRTFVRDAATRRLIDTALAVELHRAETGALPASLDALVPNYLEVVPADPFDGAALRYRNENGGYVVYAVGTDLTDDGGAPAGEFDQGNFPGDWPVRVTRHASEFQ